MTNHVQSNTARVTPTGKPLQRIPWKDKIADGNEWFKQNADFYISISNFNFGKQPGQRRDVGVLYNVYNNQFPLEWFSHVTDPLNAQNPQHKKFPAKVRPTTMLRTNIDLLLEEFMQRPFAFQVENIGEDGYNSYLDGLSKAVEKNLHEHFLAVAQQAMQEAGHAPGQDFQQVPQEDKVELPQSVKERFKSTYKDNLAIYGQKWVKRAIREFDIKQKMLKMFKDWLIAGDAYSYKGIENGNFVYERVSGMELDYDKSPNEDYIEDGEWAVRRELVTISDAVDEFYSELTDEEGKDLETRSWWATPFTFRTHLEAITDFDTYGGKIPKYHIQWKGRKKIVHVTYTDPLTGNTQELTLDENTPIDAGMKVTKTEWVNEVYETTRLGQDIYLRMQPIPVQRNAMNNFSTCKLGYNGRRYSDTHSRNVSVMEMGLPSAIMHMITNFTLEKFIAKNKGKIALIDKNTIPTDNGWTEEKFFYYSEALNWALIDRNQRGVDKSFNQYTVLDLSCWEQIKGLIELRDSFSHDWDQLLGINAQRKAQIGSSDGLGTTQEALAQSNTITGMIFTLFEGFIERELQGFLDFSRFINTDGVKSVYNLDDFDRDLLDIDPNSYCWAELGLFIQFSAQQLRILQQYKQQVQAMIQNGVKQSTILEIQQADNVAELMGKLKQLEDMEVQQAMAAKQDEHEKAMEIEGIKEKFEKTRSLLKINEINAEWDRKDDNEVIKGEYMMEAMAQKASAGAEGTTSTSADAGLPSGTDIAKNILESQKILSQERQQNADRNQKNKEHTDKMDLEDRKLDVQKQEMASRERIENKKAKVALKNKVVGERSKK